MSPSTRADAHRRSLGLAAAFGAGVFVVLAVPSLVGPWLVGLVIASIGAIVAAWLVHARSTDLVLSTIGAQPIEPGTQPRLTSLVDGLSITSGVRRPRLHLLDTPAPNAVVVGHDQESASLVVTSGLLDALNRVELEGVLAHAMSRLDTGETQVTTVAATTVGLPILLAERWLRADGPIRVVGRALTPVALLVAPLVGRVLDHDLDVRADLAGVALTRFPPGLAAALDKIGVDDPSIPSAPSSTAPLWLLPPFASADDRPIPGVVRHLPTHRPLVERVDFLRER